MKPQHPHITKEKMEHLGFPRTPGSIPQYISDLIFIYSYTVEKLNAM